MFFEDHREDYVDRCRRVLLLLGAYNRREAVELACDFCCDAMLAIALELDGTRDPDAHLYDAVMRINAMELPDEKKSIRNMVNDSSYFVEWLRKLKDPKEADIAEVSETSSGCIRIAFSHAEMLDSEWIIMMTVISSALDVMERLSAFRMYADADAAYERFRQYFLDACRRAFEAGIFTDPIPDDFDLMKE